jgi:hypothetical protein
MAVQTEVEYASTGVGTLPPQHTSIAVGSPILKYSHVNVGTTPEPEPMSLASSPQEPAAAQQTTALESKQPSPKPPTMPAAETGPGTTEVISPYPIVLVFLTEIF